MRGKQCERECKCTSDGSMPFWCTLVHVPAHMKVRDIQIKYMEGPVVTGWVDLDGYAYYLSRHLTRRMLPISPATGTLRGRGHWRWRWRWCFCRLTLLP